MKNLRDRRVIVTGAASGIGRGTALAFAMEGCRLVLVDIDEGGLASVESEVRAIGAECSSFIVDVTDAAQVERLATTLGESGGVDVLANVAGVCVVSDFVDTPLEDWRWVMGVNLWGPIHMSRAFLPAMISRRSGHIVNVASAGGLVSFAMLGSYCTTKFALVGLSEAIRQEVHADGIGVTVVCPGVTNTPIVGAARITGYSREKLEAFIRPVMHRSMSAERTGELLVRAVKKNSPLVVTGITAKVLVLLNRWAPCLVRAFMGSTKTGVARLYT